jgi:hypothetical protein
MIFWVHFRNTAKFIEQAAINLKEKSVIAHTLAEHNHNSQDI